jgi:hypothetical protein
MSLFSSSSTSRPVVPRRRLVGLGQQALVEDLKVVHVATVRVLRHDTQRLPVEVPVELQFDDANA